MITAKSYEGVDREEIAIDVWESYNNLHGIKPRGMNLWGENAMSREELIETAVYYVNASNAHFEQECKERKEREEREEQAKRERAGRAREFDQGFGAMAQAF